MRMKPGRSGCFADGISVEEASEVGISTMRKVHRAVLCSGLRLTGLAAQGGLEHLNRTERPLLRRPLASVPLELAQWSGRDEPVDPDIVERAQTTEYLSRTYESRSRPGHRLRLWINYSREGTNLRHT